MLARLGQVFWEYWPTVQAAEALGHRVDRAEAAYPTQVGALNQEGLDVHSIQRALRGRGKAGLGHAEVRKLLRLLSATVTGLVFLELFPLFNL